MIRTIKQKQPLKNIDKIKDSIELEFYAGEIDNAEIVKLLQLSAELLQLKTVIQFANIHEMSPNGVYKCRKDLIVEVSGKKFVIDNG